MAHERPGIPNCSRYESMYRWNVVKVNVCAEADEAAEVATAASTAMTILALRTQSGYGSSRAGS